MGYIRAFAAAAALPGQFMLVAWDGIASGVITVLGPAFNAAVDLVALTRASAPPTPRL